MRSLILGLVQGGIVLAVDLLLIYLLLPVHGEQVARASAFTAMILCNLGLILLNRAGKRSILDTIRSRNLPQIWITFGSLVLLALALFILWLREVFMFGPVPAEVFGYSFLAAFFSLIAANIARKWTTF